MSCTVQSIFRQHFTDYASTRSLPGHQYKAANAIMACRTAQLGGHIETCDNGHLQGVWYNSCRHRRCPQCNFLQAGQWLEKQKQRLLATAHRHIVFTIPHQLHALWLYNTAALIDVLFKATRDTLMALCQDPKYLGATPAFISALHTWGRSLSLHPHIHCLITEGGVDENGEWRSPRRACFLPSAVVSALFRGKFLYELRRLQQRGEINYPPDLNPTLLSNLMNKLGRKNWRIRLMERYAHGNGVATYLARYVRGGPIHNKQLRDDGTGHIVMHYRAHQDGGYVARQLRLTPAHFVKLYLMHVPPTGKMVVRGYGPYAPTARDTLNRVRQHFQQEPVKDAEAASGWEEACQKIGKEIPRCKTCGQPIRLGERITPDRSWKRARGPPNETAQTVEIQA